jgi:hypothetical protein
MNDIGGFPGFEVEFDKEAGLVDDGQVVQLLDFLAPGTVTDLFVFSHGWNNDMAEARALNQNFFARVHAALQGPGGAGLDRRRFAVLTVLWPSKRFADRDLIPGGAASLESPEVVYVRQQLEDLKAAFQSPSASAALERAEQLVPVLANSPAAQKEFADLLRSLLPRPRDAKEDAAAEFFALPGNELLDRLKAPILPGAAAPSGEQGGATNAGDLPAPGEGGAAGLGSFFGSVGQGITNLATTVVTAADSFIDRTTAAASNLANLTTYYLMKERAGLVGATGLSPVLRRVRDRVPGLKLHLIGHSFGGRLVTAAADGSDGGTPVKPESMTLLQAAFSHNGFARLFDGKSDGFFRQVVTGHKVAGPILISCSVKDAAVGLAYPLASRIAGQQASGLGDAGDVYGGIGRNGAQKTPEALDGLLQAVGSPYAFQAGRLYNLRADTIIGGHSDICKDEVAYALLAAVATT